MSKRRVFFKEFLKNRSTVGALSPSSRSLARSIIAPIDFNKAVNIVEFGPGTGVFTKELLKRMKPEAKLFVFETQKSFCDMIAEEIKDDRMILINDTAEKIGDYLAQHGLKEADYIVSSLPFTVIPTQIKNSILNQAVKYLSKKGLFTQYQYSLNAHKLLKSKFKEVKVRLSPFNLPPAFIYTCKP